MGRGSDSTVGAHACLAAGGLCLAAGAIASVIILVGDPDKPWQHNLRELSTLVDVLALLLWIGIFAIYWARRQRKQSRDPKQD